MMGVAHRLRGVVQGVRGLGLGRERKRNSKMHSSDCAREGYILFHVSMLFTLFTVLFMTSLSRTDTKSRLYNHANLVYERDIS